VPTSDFREDGSLVNMLTGLGTSRDRTTATQLKPSYYLSQWDVETLYKSGLPRRYVDDIPDEILRHQVTITLGGDEDDTDLIKDFEQFLIDVDFQSVYAEVMRLQRLYGGAALVLLIEDGLSPEEPVNIKTLKGISGMIPLSRYEIQPFDLRVFDLSKPDHYMISTSQRMRPDQQAPENSIKIHSSRVIRFDGLYLPWNIRRDNTGWGMSVLQLLYEEYKRYESALSGLESMVGDSDIFVHKLPGLFNKLAKGEEANIMKRLEINRMSRNVYGGMLIDSEEEVNFLARALANLATATDPFVKSLQAATGWPASILMGESPGGLGKEGRFEERVWSSICEKWQESYCRAPVTQLFKYFFAVWGNEPDSWRVEFPSVFTKTDEEEANLRNLHSTADTAWVSMGALNPMEIRNSRFGGSTYGDEIILDERFSEQMEQQAEAQHEASMLNYAMQADAAMNPPPSPEGEAAPPPEPEVGKTDAAEPEIFKNQGFQIAVTHSIEGAKVGHLVLPDGQRVDASENAPLLVLGKRRTRTPLQRVDFFANGTVVQGPYVAGLSSERTAQKALATLYPGGRIIGLSPIGPSEEETLRIAWDSYQ
jgi:uncharacterized protein